IPVLLLLGGLAVRAGIAPFHAAGLQGGPGASPLGAAPAVAPPAVAGATGGAEAGGALVGIPDVSCRGGRLCARPRPAGRAARSRAGAPPRAGFFGELGVAASLAPSGSFVLLGLGLLGSVLGVAAVLGALRVLYIQSPLEESRRGAAAALPAVTALSTAGAVAFCIVIAAYGVFGYPIMGLADQGAEALGLR